MKIKVKLILTAAIPIIAFIGISIKLISGSYQELQVAKQTKTELQSIEKLSKLNHLLQVERGLSASHLSGGASLDRLNKHRAKVDPLVADLLSHLNANYDSSNSLVQEIISQNQKIDDHRNFVNQKGEIKKHLKNYTALIYLNFSYYLYVANGAKSQAALATSLKSNYTIELGKENAGLLRANLTSTIAKNKAVPSAQKEKLSKFYFGVLNHLNTNLFSISEELTAYINDFKNTDHWKTVDVAFHKALVSDSDASFSIEPSAFFGTISKSVDYINKAIIKNQAYSKLLNDKTHASSQSYFFFLISVVGLLTLGVGYFCYNTVTKVLGAINQSILDIDDLAKGSLQPKDQLANRNDEFGKIGLSINKLKASLISIFNKDEVNWEHIGGALEAQKAAEEEARKLAKTAEEEKALAQKSAEEAEQAKAMSERKEAEAKNAAESAKLAEAEAKNLAEQQKEQVEKIKENANELAAASTQLKASGHSLKANSDDVSSTVNDSHQRFETIKDNITRVLEETRDLSSLAQKVEQAAGSTSGVVQVGIQKSESTKSNIENFEKTIENVASSLSVISEIASQTNLLALNASIESARAGEVGKGFAVVAEEVKSLAQETERVTSNVDENMKELRMAFDLIVTAIDEIRENLQEIGSLQENNTHLVNDQLLKINDMSGSVNSMSSEIQSAKHSMDSLSQVMNSFTNQANETLSVSDKMSNLSNKLTLVAS